MKESGVKGTDRGEERHLPDVAPGGERRSEHGVQRLERESGDDWSEFATEDPAFFIKTSDHE